MNVSTVASTIISLLKSLKSDKGELGKFYTDFKNATVKWIRPLFLKEEEEEEGENDLDRLISGKDEDIEPVVSAKIEYFLKKNEEQFKLFIDLIQNIETESGATSISSTIHGNNNINVQKSNNNNINLK